MAAIMQCTLSNVSAEAAKNSRSEAVLNLNEYALANKSCVYVWNYESAAWRRLLTERVIGVGVR